jgi:hypothetical protein
MNCEEYREAITADPSESFADGAVHAAACTGCSRYRDRIRTLDKRIGAALSIEVPPLQMPELVAEERTGDVVEFPTGRSGKVSAPVWLGIAAGVVLATFVGFSLLSPGRSGATLAEQVVAHMEHEQASRRTTSVSVPEQQLHKVIDPEVLAMDTGVGLVSYAQTCVINGNAVPHLVIQGESGPVTLILLPDEKIDNAIPLAGEHVHGVIVPVGHGSVAIIGERVDQLGEIDEIEQRIIKSVEWQI